MSSRSESFSPGSRDGELEEWATMSEEEIDRIVEKVLARPSDHRFKMEGTTATMVVLNIDQMKDKILTGSNDVVGATSDTPGSFKPMSPGGSPKLMSPGLSRSLGQEESRQFMEEMVNAIKSRRNQLASRRYSKLLFFVESCMNGRLEAVVYMIYKEYINVNDELLYSMSALQHACYAAQPDVVKVLLDLGGRPNYKRKNDNFTVLMAAACHIGEETDDLLECVKAVVGAGGKIDVAQTNGMTALLFAVARGHIRIAEYLLDKGADIDHRDIDGFDAIEFANRNRDTSMLALLRRHMWIAEPESSPAASSSS